MSFKKSVPSLTSLVALDAASRHKSFTLAARELGVTQTAVSRQIMALESYLGTQLFFRRHRSIEPTAECARLAAALNRHFAGIADSVAEYRAASTNGTITIGVTTALSQLWLLPRLVRFRNDYPNARIRVQSTDDRINLEAGEVDVAIRYGVAPFRDGDVVESRGDILFPVCSPDYVQRLGSTAARFWEGRYELINEDMKEPTWYTWQDWFSELGIQNSVFAPALSFNHYTAVLYAARAGQGIALGWSLLVQTFLDDGTLVRLGDASISAAGKFHIVVARRARRNLVLDHFVSWLIQELRAGSDDAETDRNDHVTSPNADPL
ncbi:LysR substrate-binding domain-containing protein [Mesorhizobium silamurunense]|uniref:LysR substrate-binding domain-containing protein n=1 Tax=Mesorhizobium silamurunense TaxID=499528 RepID=UPI00177B98B0|nr:LysR substrate-binding domain-containing protein [Mesorhizobium silamurunense]